jgi:ABC-type spermidine/putrescine transport system permease subunit II
MVNWQAVRTFSLTRRGVVFVLAALKFGWTSKTLKDCRYQASTFHSLDVSALSITAVIVVAGAAAVAVTALK